MRRRSRTRLHAKANELLQAQARPTVPDLAAAEGLKVETTFGHQAQQRRPPFSPRALDAIFRTAEGRLGTAEGQRPTELVVFRVTEITVPDFDANSEEVKRICETLQPQLLREDLFGEYLSSSSRPIGARINENALKQAVTGQRSDRTESSPMQIEPRQRPSPSAMRAASRRWSGPRWSPISKRRSRRFSRSRAAGR